MTLRHTPPHCAVLVVEDEPLVRLMAIDIVEDSGCSAYGAETADEALAILESHENITVLFTDVEMPGSLNGLDLAHRVRERWPHITIIVVSGRVVARTGDRPEPSFFVQKPYSPAMISALIHDVAHRPH